MKLRVRLTELFLINLRTRMPFRYGITTVRALPHVVLRAGVEVDGKLVHGFAADNLPPKWFTKNPQTPFSHDVREMIEVIQAACGFASQVPESPSIYHLWRTTWDAQSTWAQSKYPPLLWNFGVSLIERAIIDAFCRATGLQFHHALRNNALGLQLADLHEELRGLEPNQLLPPEPLQHIIVRHTVGLSDPLTVDEIDPDTIDDGLPRALTECIRAYGLSYFKIKISGNIEADVERLTRIASVLDEHSPDYRFTLDGNENYQSIDQFRAFWANISGSRMLNHLLFVEQPLHRDVALSNDVASWIDRPPMIIDESDSSPADVREALRLGYVGTSYKSCKGVIKGIASAGLIAQRNRQNPARQLITSAEDLTTVGISMLQDLAVVAALGIPHAERNGHHYIRGASGWPPAIRNALQAHHPDLYGNQSIGEASLTILNGRISTDSVNHAPFGVGFSPDLSELTDLAQWDPRSLEDSR